MAPRLPSLLEFPVGFAHRGARAHAPENTQAAFELAKKLGATGLESDVWLTSDGVAVLDHDGKVGRIRRRAISKVRRNELPEHMLTLEEFYDRFGTETEFSLDVKDPAALKVVVAVARNAGGSAEERLWLCHPEVEMVISWRDLTGAKLVDSTRLSKIKEGPERRADLLRQNGVDAINLRRADWTGGLISIFHRFDRYALGWDAQHSRELLALFDAGIDGVFSDHVDRLVDALTYLYPGGLQESPLPHPLRQKATVTEVGNTEFNAPVEPFKQDNGDT